MSAEVHDHEHEHHHKQNFISKYIFSLDHKMIAKYLITGIIMGIIGVGMSLLFRMQLVWPEESFRILTYYLVISGQTAL
jgi:cytochrome c oxidase subunit 1